MSDIRYIAGEAVHVYDHVVSTMDLGHELARSGRFGIIIAASQSNGRGQGGRAWSSPPGGLYLTWASPYRSQQPSTTHAVEGLAIAVVETLAAFGIDEAAIKEPNDVYVHRRKIAGVLLEIMQYGLIAGVGINVNNSLADMSESATSMSIELASAVDLTAVIATFIKSVHTVRARFERYELREVARWRHLVKRFGSQ